MIFSPTSSAASHGMYRVLTPTMYRSRMACARQALSMDYEDGDRAKIRREGPSIRRDPSPFSRARPGANVIKLIIDLRLL